MKKILSLMLCLLLLSALTTPVFAAQTAKMTVTASETELKPGDKVTFTVSVTKVENATTGGFRFTFDESVFSYEGGKRLPALGDYMAGVTTAANKLAGFFMNGNDTLEGELFRITLKVRDDAAPGTYTVTGNPSLTVSSGEITCTVVGAEVTVADTADATTRPVPTTPSVPTPTIPTLTVPDSSANGETIGDVLPGNEADMPISDGDSTSNVQQATLPQADVLDRDPPNEAAFPWWIIVAVAVVAVGGTVFLIVEIKKTKG